jgi:hypothetical protein
MYNWSIDLKKFKSNESAYTIWRLEQLINFGLNNEKLNPALVKKYWRRLRLDPQRRKFLKFILWGKKS